MKVTKLADIKHEEHEVDAQGQVLGRLATTIASLLVGKGKSYFVRNLDCGDFVKVKNAQGIKVTGKKMTDKIYTRYSGFPGGIRRTKLEDVKPEEAIRHAVSGMLPNNKLRAQWIQRLTFVG
jgi:large subunit ribosomal protein L13